MDFDFEHAQFLGITPVQRAQKCLEIADTAKKLSVTAENQELRITYQDLARQWSSLAEAIATEFRLTRVADSARASRKKSPISPLNSPSVGPS